MQFCKNSLQPIGNNIIVVMYLIKLIGNWKQALDENFVVGTIFIYLFKAFNFIPHDLLKEKLVCLWFQ